MTNDTSKKVVIAAAAILCLYSFYKIFDSISYLFHPLRFITMTSGEIASYLFYRGVDFLGLLTLGIGGLLLVYADWNKNRGMDIQTRSNRVKQTVFIMFILFSAGTIIKIIYNAFMSLKAYQIYLEQKSAEAEILLPLLISMLEIPFIIFISVGGILFGLYILLEKEKLRKTGLALYLIGTIFSFVCMIYTFVNSMITYARISSDFVQYGITMDQIYKMILSFAVSILIKTACLIIILYAMTRHRTTPDEKVNSINDITIYNNLTRSQ